MHQTISVIIIFLLGLSNTCVAADFSLDSNLILRDYTSEMLPKIISKSSTSKMIFEKKVPNFLGNNSIVKFFPVEPESPENNWPDVCGILNLDKNKNIFLSIVTRSHESPNILDAFVAIDGESNKRLVVVTSVFVLDQGSETNAVEYKSFVFKEILKKADDFTFALRDDSLENILGDGIDGNYEGLKKHYPYKDQKSILKALRLKNIESSIPKNTDHKSCYDSILQSKKRGALNLSCAVKMINNGQPKVNEITAHSVQQYNDIGYYLIEGGMFSEAIGLLKLVVAAMPSRTVAYLNLGDAYWNQSDSISARINYSEYTGQMKASGKAVKIPKKVIERLGTKAK